MTGAERPTRSWSAERGLDSRATTPRQNGRNRHRGCLSCPTTMGTPRSQPIEARPAAQSTGCPRTGSSALCPFRALEPGK